MDGNGSSLKEKEPKRKKFFRRSSRFGWNDFIEKDKVTCALKNIANNVLTVRVYLFSNKQSNQLNRRCLARTTEDVQLGIKIRSIENEDKQLMTCRINLLNTRGKIIGLMWQRYLFIGDKNEIWEIPSFLSRREILARKDDLLKQDNTFCLLCILTIPSGKTKSDILNEYQLFSTRVDILPPLLNDFQNMFKDIKFSDVKLYVNDETISAHKAILSARSPVFSAMFDHDLLESKTGNVMIKEVDTSIFKSFLAFLYSGTLDLTDISTAIELMRVADRYHVLSLREKCSSFLLSSLSVENVDEILELADMLNDSELKDSVLNSMTELTYQTLLTGEWSHWMKENQELASEIYSRCGIDIANKHSLTYTNGILLFATNCLI